VPRMLDLCRGAGTSGRLEARVEGGHAEYEAWGGVRVSVRLNGRLDRLNAV